MSALKGDMIQVVDIGKQLRNTITQSKTGLIFPLGI